MTKQYLEEAPLILAIFQLDFSILPSLAKSDNTQLLRLHDALAPLGFIDPHMIEFNETQLNLNPNQEQRALVVSQQTQARYVLRMSGERRNVELTDRRLILRATDYKNFEEFRTLFLQVLQAVTPVIGLDKAALKQTSARYVDLIVPSAGYSLDDFVIPDIRPARLSMLPMAHSREGINHAVVKMSEWLQLHMVFEELPVLNQQLHRILPLELYEPDPRAGLQIAFQPGWMEVEAPAYGILNIDHIYRYPHSPVYDEHEVMTQLDSLYANCKEVFWEIIRPQAKTCWKITEQ